MVNLFTVWAAMLILAKIIARNDECPACMWTWIGSAVVAIWGGVVCYPNGLASTGLYRFNPWIIAECITLIAAIVLGNTKDDNLESAFNVLWYSNVFYLLSCIAYVVLSTYHR